MRSDIEPGPNGLRARAIAGTYVVLVAFDCPRDFCAGLLGFGIKRTDHTNGETIWLRGLKRFDLPRTDAGDDVSTREHPIQKFHWGDYTTTPGRRYTYEVHAWKGKPGALEDAGSVSVDVTCEVPERVGDGQQAVHFNRSAAASQAFAQRFPNLPPGDVVDPRARVWLSRGLEESLISFIDSAQTGEALHLFVYEFEKDSFFEALNRARDRGVTLQILYDAMLDHLGKGPSVKSKPQIEKFHLEDVCKGRQSPGLNISHNKFMVLTDTGGVPTRVWTGSTNFTDNGIYAQTNVGHEVADPVLAKAYFTWHQTIWEAPTMSAADTRIQALKQSLVPQIGSSGTALVLSPRKTIEAVTACVERVGRGKALICFTAPFALHDDLEEALVEAPCQVLGLLNRDDVVGKALHEAPNTLLAAAGAIDQKSVLEVWQDKLLKESLHHSGVFIHTKILLIDPLSDTPLVVTGSANFSNNSSKNNDENQLFIVGETAVADVYLGEFMRMFDHYYFRDHKKRMEEKAAEDPKAPFLSETDAWTDRFYNGGEREKLRLAYF